MPNLPSMTEFPCHGCEKVLDRREFHECSTRERPVASRCRACRSESYYAKRYSTVCGQCQRHRPLDGNRVCRRCNAEGGLKQCGKCDRILGLVVSFYAGRGTCHECTKKKAPASP